VLDRADLAVAHHHVGATLQDRLHEAGDVGAVVLVVGVGVDDHVGPQLQAGVEPRLKARRQALVVGEAHDVVHPFAARHLDRLIRRAVVDHKPLHDVEALERAWQVGQREGQRLRLVPTGDLDDELHARGCPTGDLPKYPKAAGRAPPAMCRGTRG
jgi:hypothetical protein